jgi:1-acyl-sn-glycerol-3-phosphate acyltransferase
MDDWNLQPAADHGLSPASRALSLKRESGLLQTAGHAAWQGLLRSYLRLYHRLQVSGRHNLPAMPPFVIIANHTSHLDAMVLSAVLPLSLCDCAFPIAAGDVFFRTPALSWFSAAFLNAMPMWRRNCGAHAMQTLRTKLCDGTCGYILFPEGTRSRDGSLGTFRAGLGMLVAGTSIPVIPCHLTGAFAALPPGSALPRPRRLHLQVGEPLRFGDLQDSRDGWQQVAARAHAAVAELSAKHC